MSRAASILPAVDCSTACQTFQPLQSNSSTSGMQNITYANVSDAPSELARAVRFVLTDGEGGTSNMATKTINVTAVNDPPVITTTGSPLAYTENEAAKAIDTGLTMSDLDNKTITVVASYTDGHGTAESVTSSATAAVTNVNDAPTGLPVITGALVT